MTESRDLRHQTKKMGDKDRHTTPRVYESGAKKRKLSEARAKKHLESMSKVPKLTAYFAARKQTTEASLSIPQSEGAATTSTSESTQSVLTPIQSSQQMETVQTESSDPRTPVTESADTVQHEHGHLKEVQEANVKDNGKTRNQGFETDIGLWPESSTEEMITYWAREGSVKLQHCDEKLIEKASKPQEQQKAKSGMNYTRKCSRSLFQRKTLNNEIVNRSWLCFSPTTGKVYCYPCKLVATGTEKGKLSTDGFYDWKHGNERIADHEKSKGHLESIITLANRGKEHGRIDQDLAKQEAELRDYWCKLLMRIVSTIKFIAERGLAFRGTDEVIGSQTNGNYLGILELLSEYDPFLAAHIKLHANRGRGHTNYLSSTICEEVIEIMGELMLEEIIARIKKSKYYSVSLDSTPDEAHIDQLTLIIRYMEGPLPKERFLTFMDNQGHTGVAMANALLEFLESHNIDIKDCRGQSYDNAANMSGKYRGMQALIKEKNPLSEFVPCCGHSLNLVGKTAANTCSAALHYFDFVQQLYVFFTARTSRYATLKDKLVKADKQVYVPKRLSETRWSCRADATKAIVHGYSEIREALYDILTDEENKAVVQNEASNLYEKMGKLETAVYVSFWNGILERFNATNHILQDPKMVLSTAVKALKSLETFIETKRDKFDEYEEAGIKLSGTKEYTEVRHRVRNVRLNPLDYGKAEDTQMTPRERFRTESFITVIDQSIQSLSDRIAAYDKICERFGFLSHMEDMTANDLSSAAANLVSIYNTDLESSLEDELVHFAAFIKLNTGDYNGSMPKELYFYKILLESGLEATFRNVEIMLRIYLVLMVTNCSGERSFSKLKIIKNRLRTSMTQSRLSWLAIMSIERDILCELDFQTLIQTFASQKARKPVLFI